MSGAARQSTLCMQWDSFMDYRSRHGNESYAIIIGTSAVALAYNVVHALMIQRTSAVTTTVLGQAKVIGLLVLSCLLLGALQFAMLLPERTTVTCILLYVLKGDQLNRRPWLITGLLGCLPSQGLINIGAD